jgi:hypothetical protein
MGVSKQLAVSAELLLTELRYPSFQQRTHYEKIKLEKTAHISKNMMSFSVPSISTPKEEEYKKFRY